MKVRGFEPVSAEMVGGRHDGEICLLPKPFPEIRFPKYIGWKLGLPVEGEPILPPENPEYIYRRRNHAIRTPFGATFLKYDFVGVDGEKGGES